MKSGWTGGSDESKVCWREEEMVEERMLGLWAAREGRGGWTGGSDESKVCGRESKMW